MEKVQIFTLLLSCYFLYNISYYFINILKKDTDGLEFGSIKAAMQDCGVWTAILDQAQDHS